ncbi:DUF2147 domain-containing protein [Helicobacter saguini]|uniref:DUF2147 domain-containing protein n=1 Tax=Helicobacter saguini TaxID=1548018 RepID=A0A347VIJ2_9HELI|nr:DUF2147 domain-containing protein [Helicobacter saguini]MWV62722.1 DUF2147 domain-containing protein [Helicobacter saguini]MWV66607.1 DUF2147 domain-containing protein [Helicobacter saguini]MWV68958.1 DUF2147 domain-containing protein [Helicobacter saguini]MWV71489.1 DUF2147 domain-containing protein [Helicobacter saguini]TLD92192.1 DUF2147 domain-containing protein [Helicobacter saguini]
MKKILLVIILLNVVFAYDISGLYDMSFGGNDNYVEVFKKNNKYYAVAFTNKEEIQKGENNKQNVEASKYSVFVWNLLETTKGKYENGKILDMLHKHIYYASAKYDGGKFLEVRVSEDKKGILGMTLKWRKLDSKEIESLKSRRVDINKLALPK